MKEVDETIEFMENKLQELRKFRQEKKNQQLQEDLIEERLEKIENAILEIQKGIIG